MLRSRECIILTDMRKSMLCLLLCLCFCKAQGYAQETALKGCWITNTEDTTAWQAPCFRKQFALNHPVKKATLLVCGVGYHKTFVNGKEVTAAVLEQGYTRYDKRLLYTSYEVTGLLQQGKNCLAAELGNGWYNVHAATIWFFHRIGWRKTPRLLANLLLEYADGSSELLVTDSSWKYAVGPRLYNGLHAGEIYDARKEMPGWNTADFDDASWRHAKHTGTPGGRLELQQMPSVQVIRRIQPVSVNRLGNGRWLFDMGQNLAGVATLRVLGKTGDSVILRYGEMLNATGGIDKAHNAGQMLLRPGHPDFQTDIYLLKGGGMEAYTPAFTYHGFQYVEVQAPTEMQLDKNSLEGLFYSTNFAQAGSFSSSDTMLNRLYAAALQSYRSNFISIPTDCPQREKNGWTADAHLAAELGLWNFAAAPGYRKWLNDLRDVQLEDGTLPGIAPTLGRGYHWTDKNDDGFGPAWASALPLIAWYVYLYEGDTSVIRENYVAVQLMVDRMARRAEKYIYSTGFGDWMALQETPVPFISTACFYADTKLLSQMAAILGYAGDAERYGRLGDSIRMAFNERFLRPDRGLYGDSAITALSGALFHDLCPPEYRAKVAERLVAGIKARNYHADFGALGTKYVWPALCENGYADVALKLLTDTGYAGWGHWIAGGATTLFEDWAGKESRNHVFFGDYAGSFYFKYLAGIQPDKAAPGFRHFTVHPVFPASLHWVKATHATRYGIIAVNWQKQGRAVKLTVTVPEGTTADITLPGYERELTPGTYNIRLQLK